MSSPKEKAQELFDKMYSAMPHQSTTNAQTYIIAKQCAIEAVDEILEATKMHQYAYGEIGSKTIYHNYWQEVKEEISNL